MDEQATFNHPLQTFPEHLIRMGWTSHFQTALEELPSPCTPARVIGGCKNSFLVNQGTTPFSVAPAATLEYTPEGIQPVVGDWVVVKDEIITSVLERRNILVRGAAGSKHKQKTGQVKEQIMAANIDTVFIVCGLDRDFNLRRLERYLTLVYNCGLTPAIVLTKADLEQHPQQRADEVEAITFGVPVHLISAHEENGVSALDGYLAPGQTVTLIGSSGAGKSTLINRLYGADLQATGAVSKRVGKGRHTTTTRDLITLPSGGMVIDNPGMREITFSDDHGALDTTFPEIEFLTRSCRFADCSHTHEPGCQVLDGVASGQIPRERLDSYLKMQRELAFFANKEQKSAPQIEKETWKGVSLKIKAMKKGKKKG